MLWRSPEHEPLVESVWDAARARTVIAEIVSDAEAAAAHGAWPGHPLDDLSEGESPTGLYMGSAGMTWALHRLGSGLDLERALALTLDRFPAAPDCDRNLDVHAPSLWIGETGLVLTAHAIGAPADLGRLGELIRANRAHETWELMWGSPGTILAARVAGLRPEWSDSAQRLVAAWDEATDMWPHVLYGKPWPHLGPPHGFAGNVHVLRGFVDEQELRARVTRLLTRTAVHRREGGLVNWPPVDGPFAEQADRIRVQWCHGAPGLVATLGDLMPLELAVGGGELTWRAGPLAKGPGLCHGTAGNGFAFLRLHALTGDRRWLERARSFGMHAAGQVRGARGHYGRGRYSLWTGDVGVALFLAACLTEDPAVPTIDVF